MTVDLLIRLTAGMLGGVCIAHAAGMLDVARALHLQLTAGQECQGVGMLLLGVILIVVCATGAGAFIPG